MGLGKGQFQIGRRPFRDQAAEAMLRPRGLGSLGMVKLRLSVMMFAQYFAWGVWLVPLSTYMSQGLHFDTIIGTTFGLIGIATIVSTLFIGMVADRFIAAQKLLGILPLGPGEIGRASGRARGCPYR